MPPSYWIQCQVGLALTGLPAWELGVLHTLSETFQRHTIAPDVETTREMLERASAWYEAHVVGGDPPAVDGSDDARRWILSRHPRETIALRQATAEEADLVREVARLRAEIRELDAEEKAAAARLTLAIGDAAGFELPGGGGRATWKAQSTSRIDVARLRAERPDVAAEFTSTTESRVLRVPKEST